MLEIGGYFEGLFCPEAFDGVGHSSFDGVEADGEQGQGDGAEAGGSEDPPGHAGAVGIAAQPLPHEIPGQRDCDHQRQEDEKGKFAAEQFPEREERRLKQPDTQ